MSRVVHTSEPCCDLLGRLAAAVSATPRNLAGHSLAATDVRWIAAARVTGQAPTAERRVTTALVSISLSYPLHRRERAQELFKLLVRITFVIRSRLDTSASKVPGKFCARAQRKELHRSGTHRLGAIATVVGSDAISLPSLGGFAGYADLAGR